MPEPNVTVWPADNDATAVFRHMRSLEYRAGTWMSVVPAFTTKYWPVRAFSGRPPSAGGLKRGSRHVPVHDTGSVTASKWVSL